MRCVCVGGYECVHGVVMCVKCNEVCVGACELCVVGTRVLEMNTKERDREKPFYYCKNSIGQQQ